MKAENYENRKDEVMKKQIISTIILIMIAVLFGLTGKGLATNQAIVGEEGIVENYLENTNDVTSNMQAPGTNATPTDYVNNISDQLQNMVSKQQPKDQRRQVAVTTIIIITILLIIGLVTWYYMTNL